ncbi:hypothetical protein [Brevundimonas sp.]|nr:hypothetical protein [Brevundimonas sp.]
MSDPMPEPVSPPEMPDTTPSQPAPGPETPPSIDPGQPGRPVAVA